MAQSLRRGIAGDLTHATSHALLATTLASSGRPATINGRPVQLITPVR